MSINESTRTAATDGALSFSILVSNQQELTLGSARSGVTGLLSAIRSAPAAYAQLLEAAGNAFDTQAASASKLNQPPWKDASAATQQAIQAALNSAYAALISAQRSQVTAARDQAAVAENSATNPSTERTLAGNVEAAGDLLLTALNQLEANNDAAGLNTLSTARAQGVAALASAQAHLAALQSMGSPPAARIAVTQATIAAAQSLIAAADAAAASTLKAAAGETATTHQLTSESPPTTYLTTYGTSGTFSLTDEKGQGVLISSDGKVDTIPSSGQGWQFQKDSTFLLPDGTKVSISPGTPASVLATRGQQSLSLSPLQPGAAPTVVRSTTGGLAADAARNDGYVIQMGGSPGVWTLSGATLGDESSREVVATTPLTHEEAVDVTLVPLPSELGALLAALQVDPAKFDTDGDGLYSNAELRALVASLDSAVGGLHQRFDAALANTTTALESLLKLNAFIEKILAESERKQDGKKQISAEEREQLAQIQRDLAQALAALRNESARPSERVNVLADALTVLDQLEAPQTTPPNPSDPVQRTESVNNPGGPLAPPGVSEFQPPVPPKPAMQSGDAVPAGFAQSMRRAERLLSGFGGGSRAPLVFEAPLTEKQKGPLLQGEKPSVADGPGAVKSDVKSDSTTPDGAIPPNESPNTPEQNPQSMPGSDLPLSFGQAARAESNRLDDEKPQGPGQAQGFSKQQQHDETPARDALSTGTFSPPLAKPSKKEDPIPGNVVAFKQTDALRASGSNPREDNATEKRAPGNLEQSNPIKGPSDNDAPTQPSPLKVGTGVGSPADSVTPFGGGPVPNLPPLPEGGGIPPGQRVNSDVSIPPLAPLAFGDGSGRMPVAPVNPSASQQDQLARSPNGLPPLPGSQFSAVGPDPAVSPDPTFGASDGFDQEYSRRFAHHRARYDDQLDRSRVVQAEVRTVVEKFLVLVGQDENLRQVFTASDLSDEQRDAFKTKVETIERELGLSWGGQTEKTPQGEAKLNARILTSGMMI